MLAKEDITSLHCKATHPHVWLDQSPSTDNMCTYIHCMATHMCTFDAAKYCTHQYTFMYTHTSTPSCTLTPVHLHVHSHQCTFMYTHTSTPSCTLTPVHLHVHSHQCTFMYTHTSTPSCTLTPVHHWWVHLQCTCISEMFKGYFEATYVCRFG